MLNDVPKVFLWNVIDRVDFCCGVVNCLEVGMLECSEEDK